MPVLTPNAHAQMLEYERDVINKRLECLKRSSNEFEMTFASEIAEAFKSVPKRLDPKFFYDDAGSALFEKICNLDEYYVMRVESKLLRTHANDIAKYTASTMRLVELGSGASIKTQIILDAMGADARPIEYMPVDISKVIGENCMYLLDAYDEITVKGIVDTYEKGLELVKNLDHTPSLIAFLGSSLGNMNPEIALEFLRTVRSCMRKGDLFLIGLDLNKSADILHAAYDDACGITAKFNKNILHRINSELGADFDHEQFEHHVVYDEKQMRVGMYLKSMQRQTVSIPKSGIRTVFEKDEMIHTENSFKYTPDSIKLMLSQAGLKIENMWCDDDKMFSLTLASLKD